MFYKRAGTESGGDPAESCENREDYNLRTKAGEWPAERKESRLANVLRKTIRNTRKSRSCPAYPSQRKNQGHGRRGKAHGLELEAEDGIASGC